MMLPPRPLLRRKLHELYAQLAPEGACSGHADQVLIGVWEVEPLICRRGSELAPFVVDDQESARRTDEAPRRSEFEERQRCEQIVRGS
jgi:hypothetical protein